MVNKSIYTILRARYPEGEYVLMEEVSNAAGFGRSNSADYIAVNLWPSRGLAISGIELKSFRNDWLREMKNPKKAEGIFKHCDFFWLLTSGDNIAKIEEIPITWGWMNIVGDRIRVMKEAPQLTPVPLDKSFLVCMLRRAADKSNFVHVDTIQDKIQAAKDEALRIAENNRNNSLRMGEEYKKIVNDFQEASGVSLGKWKYNPKKVGAAIKFINSGGWQEVKRELEGLKIKSEYIMNQINKALSIELEPVTENQHS